MNTSSCRCMEKSTHPPCDPEFGHVQNRHEVLANHHGCTDCHFKLPHHNYVSHPPQEENTNAHERRPSNKVGEVRLDNHEPAKIMPRDRTMINPPSTHMCYSERESDSIHQAYALSQKNAQSNSTGKCESSETMKIHSHTGANSTGKCLKPEPSRCQHQNCQNSEFPDSNLKYTCASSSEKFHTGACVCHKAVPSKPITATPLFVNAMNVVRPPCPYCGSRMAKCLGCGNNTYGQAYTPTYPPTIDPAIQFNSCSSASQQQPPPPPPPTIENFQKQQMEDACEKRLDSCIRDVSKNLTWVLNSLQRFKYCPVCGNPNCTS